MEKMSLKAETWIRTREICIVTAIAVAFTQTGCRSLSPDRRLAYYQGVGAGAIIGAVAGGGLAYALGGKKEVAAMALAGALVGSAIGGKWAANTVVRKDEYLRFEEYLRGQVVRARAVNQDADKERQYLNEQLETRREMSPRGRRRDRELRELENRSLKRIQEIDKVSALISEDAALARVNNRDYCANTLEAEVKRLLKHRDEIAAISVEVRNLRAASRNDPLEEGVFFIPATNAKASEGSSPATPKPSRPPSEGGGTQKPGGRPYGRS